MCDRHRRRGEAGVRELAFGLREAIGGNDLVAAVGHALPFGRDARARIVAAPDEGAFGQRDMRRGEPLGQCRRPVDIEVC